MKTIKDHPNNYTKKCTSCTNALPVTEFYKKGSEGFESRCKKCVLQSKKKYYTKKYKVKKSRSAFNINEYSITDVHLPPADEKETSNLKIIIEALLCQKRK